MSDLIDSLINRGYLRTPRIIEAFQKINRNDFLPPEMKNLGNLDEALPLGYGQTISQPLVVAFMLEQLNPLPGDKILDIGSGSGWTTALLAYIISQKENKKGKVIALEIIPELKEFGAKNVAKYNFIEKGIAQFVCADGSKGYREEAPFDKILVSAAGSEEKKAWQEQLKIKGRIVAPIGSSIWTFVKTNANEWEETEYPGFVFVPLIEK
ncbi:MAG: protein-L-isoaspartate O-methyltransferase [bacterium]